jgi:BCCT family betaine/carnitine transporter
VSQIYDWIAHELGLAYQWATIAATVLLIWLAFGRYANRTLGGPESTTEYGTISWMGMLFCAGIGAGLLYWSAIEWGYYVDEPPFGIAAGTDEAREWAATYGIFHWGFSAWCLYCLPTVAIAYPYYNNRLPYLRLSGALVGLFGPAISERPLGRVVDVIFIIALIGGTGTSLGLATPMIAAVMAELAGIESSFALELGVSVVCVVLFGTSVYLGLDRGIKRLSNINVGIAFAFLLWVLITGPTLFVLKLGTNSLGLMMQEFIRMNTWTDPLLQTGFVENWTVFYWAWWIAYGPFMGLFVTRISRGRTLRQLIFGMVGFGTLGCASFYIVVGNTAMWLDMNTALDLLPMLRDGHASSAIARFVASLPGNPVPLILFVVMAFVFVATTYDSASYTIAASATRGLLAGENPQRWHRVFWALALAVLPIALIMIGTLQAAQSAVLVVSLPLLIIGVLMVVSLLRSLKAGEPPVPTPLI